MHDVTQYISAAIHEGLIDPQEIVERVEQPHKAKTIELGVDEQFLYLEAKVAKSRNDKINLLMLVPTVLLLIVLLNADFDWGLEELSIKILFIFLLVFVVVFIKQIVVNKYLGKIYTRSNEIESIKDDKNVVLSGGFSPFSGYGVDLDGWSFTVDLKKSNAQGEAIPETVDVKDLLNTLSDKVQLNIDLAEISDKIFISGKDVRNNKIFMDSFMSKPRTKVKSEVVDDFVGKSGEHIRHYRVITIPAWKGQIIMTVFIRFNIVGNQLFSESKFFFLTPLKEELMVLDKVPSRAGFRYFFLQTLVMLFKSIYSWMSGPLWIISGLTKFHEAIFGDPEDKIKRSDVGYNYAYATSLRESWSSSSYQRYFQMADKDMNFKVLQHIIINGIVDYLDEKGISTEDIKERQTTILNSGVMVTGGTMQAGQMSVGKGSSVNNNNTTS